MSRSADAAGTPPRASTAPSGVRGVPWLGALVVLVLGAAALLWFGRGSIPALRSVGLGVLTEARWAPAEDLLGLAAAIGGTLQVMLMALLVAMPLALGTALFVTEYAPARVARFLDGLLHVLAAIPSVAYGAWALVMLQPHAVGVSRWLAQHLGWLPVFRAGTDADSPLWERSEFTASVLVIGLAVAAMVVPFAASLLAEGFRRTPLADRDAARALGATRAGVIRSTVLPLNRRTIAGSALLAAGRAVGEAVIVVLLVGPAFDLHVSLVTSDTTTLPALIAGRFADAGRDERSALYVAALLVLLLTAAMGAAARALFDDQATLDADRTSGGRA